MRPPSSSLPATSRCARSRPSSPATWPLRRTSNPCCRPPACARRRASPLVRQEAAPAAPPERPRRAVYVPHDVDFDLWMRGVSRPMRMRVISDPTRAQILCLTLESPDGRVVIGRLADALGLRQPTVSHHREGPVDEGFLRGGARRRRSGLDLCCHRGRTSVRTGAVRSRGGRVGRRARSGRVRSLARFAGNVLAETVARFVQDSHACSPNGRGPPATCVRSPRGLPPNAFVSLASS